MRKHLQWDFCDITILTLETYIYAIPLKFLSNSLKFLTGFYEINSYLGKALLAGNVKWEADVAQECFKI